MQRVFDGAHVRATLFAQTSAPRPRGLFVSLRQRIDTPGSFDVAQPARSFTGFGFDHLHLQSRENDWFINPETLGLSAALEALSAGYGDVCGMGFSMGGYGLLRFAGALRLRRVVLVSPQMSIHPEVVPWDRRYRDCAGGFDRALGDLSQVAAPGLGGVVLFDPFRPLDRRHAAWITATFGGVSAARLGCGGHPATRVIGSAGRFGALQKMLREDRITAARVTELHRGLRRDAPIYWQHLARQARKSGRFTLVKRAEGQQTRAEAKKAGPPA